MLSAAPRKFRRNFENLRVPNLRSKFVGNVNAAGGHSFRPHAHLRANAKARCVHVPLRYRRTPKGEPKIFMERWLSGLRRYFAKVLGSYPTPRVRIPFFPILRFISNLQSKFGTRSVSNFLRKFRGAAQLPLELGSDHLH